MSKSILLFQDRGGDVTDAMVNMPSGQLSYPSDVPTIDGRLRTLCTLLHTQFTNAKITTRQYAIEYPQTVSGKTLTAGRFSHAGAYARCEMVDGDGKYFPIILPMPQDQGLIVGQDGRYHIDPTFGQLFITGIGALLGTTMTFVKGHVKDGRGARSSVSILNGVGITFEDQDGIRKEMSFSAPSDTDPSAVLTLVNYISTNNLSCGKIVAYRIKSSFSFPYADDAPENSLSTGSQDLVGFKAHCRFAVTSAGQVVQRFRFDLPAPKDAATETITASKSGKRLAKRRIAAAKGEVLAAAFKTFLDISTGNVKFLGGNVYGR